jgi:hypothetical protein
MYSTKGTTETQFVSKYIEPGIHRVRINSIEGQEPEGRSPYIQITFEDKDSKTADIRFYMSEKAMPKSLEKIKHIGTKLVTEDELDGINADNLAGYGAALNKLLAGKGCRIKFTGEEVDGEKGRWWKAGIGLPTFAEATKEGAQYEPVSDEDSRLTFDKTNQYDWKPLPDADMEYAGEPVGAASDDDDPF